MRGLRDIVNYLLNQTWSQSQQKYLLQRVQLQPFHSLSILHCQDEFKWEFETNYVSDGGMIDINENLCDYYKDQGHATDDSDVPADDTSNFDANYNENVLFEQVQNTLE